MTTLDGVVLTIGAAFSLASLPAWLSVAASYPWSGLGMFLRNSAGFWVAAVSLSAVAVGRSARYRRLPRSAEWLALSAFAWGLTIVLSPSSHEDLVRLIGRLLAWLTISESAVRWTTAALVTVMVGAGWVVVRVGRSFLTAWVQTIWLVFLLFLLLWSPLTVIADHAANWFAPANGFGRGDLMILYRGGCRLLALTPLTCLLGLPVVATVAERVGGRTWTWLEWSAAITAALAGLLGSIVYRGEYTQLSLGWLAERLMTTGWIALVGWLDLTRLRRFHSQEFASV